MQGKEYAGANIIPYFKSLPKMQHKISMFTIQPTPNQGRFYANVIGQIKFQDGTSHLFSEAFIFAQDGGAFKIINQIFRSIPV